MNIAIFVDGFAPQFNGVVTYVINTASELTRRGNKVVVFAPEPKRGEKINLNKYSFKVILMTSMPALVYPDYRLTIPAIPTILLELRKFHPDIIHIMDPLNLGTEGILAAKILQKPIVITFHTFFMDEDILRIFKLHKRAGFLQTPLWRLTTYYHNLADVVICPSKISQKELEMHGLKRPSVIISNGIDLTQTKKPQIKNIRCLRRKYGLKDSDKVGLFVGRVAADKSINTLIETWRKVVDKLKDAKLVIIGSGPEERKLKDYTVKLGLQDNIIFTGAINHEEIIQNGLYYIGDIFVTASKIENQSLSMLEAMAHGLPLVGVNFRGTPELIDSKNGILVDGDDSDLLAKACIKILTNEQLIHKLQKGSLHKIQEFSLDKSVERLEATYRILAKFKTL